MVADGTPKEYQRAKLQGKASLYWISHEQECVYRAEDPSCPWLTDAGTIAQRLGASNRVRGRLFDKNDGGVFLDSHAASGRAGFKPAPTEPRYAVWGGTRGVILTPSASSGQAPPSPVEGEGVRAPSPLTVQLCGSPLATGGGERPGCVESMGAPWGSGSCQCCSRFSLILRSAGVSSTGAGSSAVLRTGSARTDPSTGSVRAGFAGVLRTPPPPLYV